MVDNPRMVDNLRMVDNHRMVDHPRMVEVVVGHLRRSLRATVSMQVLRRNGKVVSRGVSQIINKPRTQTLSNPIDHLRVFACLRRLVVAAQLVLGGTSNRHHPMLVGVVCAVVHRVERQVE